MKFNISNVKIIVTVPPEYSEKIRQVLGELGTGIIGNYSYCSNSQKTIGRFIPNSDANPFIGEKNKLESVEEEKIEVSCSISILKEVLKSLREAHPYEEPAIDIIPLIDEKDLEDIARS